MRRTRWIAGIVVIAAAIAVAWTARHGASLASRHIVINIPPSASGPSSARAATVDSRTTPRSSRAAAKVVPAHALPDSSTPLAEAVQTLREYAEEGDTDAAVELSWRLSYCTERALRESEESEQSLRNLIEEDKDNKDLDESLRASRAKNVQRQIDEHIQARADCRALPAELRAGWLDWIDRGAQAGNTAAMRGYARMAIGEYYSVGDVLADLDTAIERRDKARAYLDEALQRGDAETLRDLANTYRRSAHPTIYPLDEARAYAYAYAGTLAGIARGNDLEELMEEAARSLDGRQLADAEAEGRSIYETCCAHP